ncbi:MAG: ion transporter [SAR324 cluster bacterium]|nr:ion transporter [SAR324 cluster bacterium]
MILKNEVRKIIDPGKALRSKIFGVFIQFLVIASVVEVGFEMWPEFSPVEQKWLFRFEAISVAIFTLEYTLRIWVSENRLKFVTSVYGLVDLLAILPFYLSIGIDLRTMRGIRLIRLVRLFKLFRYRRAIRQYIHAVSMKGRVLFFIFLPILTATSTVGIYLIEGGANSPYDSLFNSLWWTVVTFTTVGYGDMAPTSIQGRSFGLFVVALGVLINSIIISSVSTWFFSLRSSRAKGLKSVRITGHVLICSDNPTFIRALLEEHQDFVEDEKIVLISPLDKNPLEGTKFDKVPWIHGDAYLLGILKKASAKLAKMAYVDYSDESDSVMTVMQLEVISPGIKTMAQYLIHEYQAHLSSVGCDYALKKYDLYVPLMVHACKSGGMPIWIRELIMRFESPTIENHLMPADLNETNWLDYTLTAKKQKGEMPLGYIDLKGKMHLNPPHDCVPGAGAQILSVVPPFPENKGDTEKDGIEIIGIEQIPEEGHILIASDDAPFISRMLDEIEQAELGGHIVVLSNLDAFPDKMIQEGIEWVQTTSHSDYSARLGRAHQAKIAFIDYIRDSHTLMAVLRFEGLTKGSIFTVASYQEPFFDQRLIGVGCDFCVNVNELIAPALSQHALHPGVGQLLERVVAHTPNGENLNMMPVTKTWGSGNWLDTIAFCKSETGKLPVGIVRNATNRLYVNPHPDFKIQVGDDLVVLDPELFCHI